MSKIEWTDKTWNPVTGCTKHSEGCQNCYACTMTNRLKAMGQEKYKDGFEKVVFHPKELQKADGLFKAGNRYKHNVMWFVNSMSDTFHKDVTRGQIVSILTTCSLWDENNIFQILTKRAERLPDFEYPENVWLGVTVEMAKYKSRMQHLKQTNAKIKFLSCEPLLEDLGELDLSGIDWVICGGESGPGARPMHPDWVRNIQKQCVEQKVPFFFKQWGEYIHCTQGDFENTPIVVIKHRAVGISTASPDFFFKVGKKKSGSLLDGKEYKEFPEVEQ